MVVINNHQRVLALNIVNCFRGYGSPCFETFEIPLVNEESIELVFYNVMKVIILSNASKIIGNLFYYSIVLYPRLLQPLIAGIWQPIIRQHTIPLRLQTAKGVV